MKYEKFLSLLIAKGRSSNVVTVQNSTYHWLYLNQQGALVKEIFLGAPNFWNFFIWRGVND